MDNESSGKTALITGAGSGIGRAIALAFAASGAEVVAADINAAGALETCAMIESAGAKARSCIVDVGNEDSIAAMVGFAAETSGRIDVLCNNAGVMDRMEPIAELSTAQWDRVLRINLSGVMFGTRAVLPLMLAQGGGAIINTASIASLRGGAAGAAYTAAKHGIVGLTKSTAWAYRKSGIRCNAICPGAVQTNVDGGLGFAAFDPAGLEICGPVLALNPIIAVPEQIAGLAVFLASKAGSMINGAVVPIDAGWASA